MKFWCFVVVMVAIIIWVCYMDGGYTILEWFGKDVRP